MALTERELMRLGEKVLERTKPTKISQVRQIWIVVKRMRDSHRAYKQIWESLLPELGIEMSYRQFLSACWAIRCRRKPRRKSPAQRPKEIQRQSAVEVEATETKKGIGLLDHLENKERGAIKKVMRGR